MNFADARDAVNAAVYANDFKDLEAYFRPMVREDGRGFKPSALSAVRNVNWFLRYHRLQMHINTTLNPPRVEIRSNR